MFRSIAMFVTILLLLLQGQNVVNAEGIAEKQCAAAGTYSMQQVNILNAEFNKALSSLSDKLNAKAHVVATQTRGFASMDVFAKGKLGESGCYDPVTDQFDPNLIALVLTIQEREVKLYAGKRWESDLRKYWPQIMDSEVNPVLLRTDTPNYSEGLTVALSEITKALEKKVVSQKTTSTVTTSDADGTTSSAPLMIFPAALIVIVILITKPWKWRKGKSKR